MFRSLYLKTLARRNNTNPFSTPHGSVKANSHSYASQDDTFQTRTALHDTITVVPVPGHGKVTILRIHGWLNGDTYEAVIEKGEELIQAGITCLVIDLGEVTNVSMIGLVALHNLARLINGQSCISTEDGWDAIHVMAADRDRGLPIRLKLVCPQPIVTHILQRTGMDTLFDSYEDYHHAIESF